MSFNFYNYYKEIRNRFFLIILTWISCLIVCYSYKEILLFALINFNYSLIECNKNFYFIFTDITEVFTVYMELSIFMANQIVIVFLLYQIVMFFTSSLYKFEYIRLQFALKVFITSWLLSTVLLYSLIIPFSWNFFLGFRESSNNQSFELFFETRLIEYFHYFTSIYYISLINCQFLGLLTVIVLTLNKRLKQSTRFRKLFYLIFIVFSTMVTPPDIISQISLTLLLIITYEVLLLVRFININMVTN